MITLEPGDVVSTGTHHQGLRPVTGGEKVRLEIGGLGPPLEVITFDAEGREWSSARAAADEQYAPLPGQAKAKL